MPETCQVEYDATTGRMTIKGMYGEGIEDSPACMAAAIEKMVEVKRVPRMVATAEAREYEPLRALDGGSDGLEVACRALAEAAHWTATQGIFMFETSRAQAEAAVEAAADAGWRATVRTDDELEATVIECRLPW